MFKKFKTMSKEKEINIEDGNVQETVQNENNEQTTQNENTAVSYTHLTLPTNSLV